MAGGLVDAGLEVAPVVLFRIVGGDHEPPAKSRGQDIGAAEEVWQFFREAGLPAK